MVVTELMSCVKVEVAVLGTPSLINLWFLWTKSNTSTNHQCRLNTLVVKTGPVVRRIKTLGVQAFPTYGDRWNHSQQSTTRHLCAGNTETFVPSSTVGINRGTHQRTCLNRLCHAGCRIFFRGPTRKAANFLHFLREREFGQNECESTGKV